MTQEEMIQKIKKRIEYHADQKKYGYFIGSGIMDYLAADILKDLQIADLTARAEQAEAKLKEGINDMRPKENCDVALAALREKTERSKGCEYCLSRFGIAAHHVNQAGMQAGTKINANFCPVCGAFLQGVRGNK